MDTKLWQGFDHVYFNQRAWTGHDQYTMLSVLIQENQVLGEEGWTEFIITLNILREPAENKFRFN
jgi:hypothetical protein